MLLSRYTPISFQFGIHTDVLSFSLVPTAGSDFILNRSQGKVEIKCPESKMTTDEKRQQWLRNVIREQLRVQAKQYLTLRLRELSEKAALPYEQLTIRRTSSRWGSCTRQRHISLSLYLMLLSSEFIDSVLLHELCHTREMNHGPRFWELLNSLTDGKAREQSRRLRRQVREWHEQGDPRGRLMLNRP